MINKEDSALSVMNKVYFSGWYLFFEKFKRFNYILIDSLGGGFDKIGTAL